MEAGGLIMVHWWYEASFEVNNDFKIHTGEVLSLRKGKFVDLSKNIILIQRALWNYSWLV